MYIGVAYSCLKYAVFITPRFNAINTVSARGNENFNFDLFSFGGSVGKRCSMFNWTVISAVADVVCLYQGFIKAINCTININLSAWNMRGC